ncbi:valine--tRNA ligase, mitochondrial 1 isoform X2 [Capsella rubella]|uniref:valine--tRNA ligase, mitochondrial 1 isoform X2 n=1 Tax=Capsella rubella TaxID=81985 RepID=UPI000CD51A94|nr:valine--tRNA ligase, mitochondrial 1 isoform X2 [Capsella rubella]
MLRILAFMRASPILMIRTRQRFTNCFGSDALRFALVSYTAQILILETMPFSCKWILSVLNKAISKTVESLEAFEFSDAANTVYAWWQYQFCDVYIEAIKPYFASDNPTFASERAHAQHALWTSLETGLRLLHPLMPFVTEELWQRLPSPKDTERKASIMMCDYPTAIETWTNEKVESEMETVHATVKCMRALRAGLLEKQKSERLPGFALCENNLTSEIVKSHEFEIRTLANLSSLEVFIKGEHAASPGSSVETVNENLKVYLKVEGAINTEAEQEKIRNKLGELHKQKDKLQKMMRVSTYEEKVPANIREDNATKLAKILQEFDFFEKESARLAA